MNKQKNIILLLSLVSLTLYSSSRAQSQSADSTSLKEGIWALQFGIAGNFTLTSFQGSTIGAMYKFSDRNAIRGGITISSSTNDATSSSSGSIADTSDGSAPESNSTKSATVSIVLQYLWYTNPNGPVHLYAGLGPLVSYSYSDYSTNYPYLYSVTNNGSTRGYWIQDIYSSNSTQWGAGGAGVLGVEWFACGWLSLHADYSESVQYRWGTNSSNEDYPPSTYPNYISSQTSNSGTSKGWTFSSSGVAFGLNIYL